jgi:hypothetical protein
MRRVASWLGRQKELELRQNKQKKRRILSFRASELSLLHGLVQLIANLRRYAAVARSWTRRAADSAGGTGARDRSSTARRIPTLQSEADCLSFRETANRGGELFAALARIQRYGDYCGCLHEILVDAQKIGQREPHKPISAERSDGRSIPISLI